jgi:hypothetical protein
MAQIFVPCVGGTLSGFWAGCGLAGRTASTTRNPLICDESAVTYLKNVTKTIPLVMITKFLSWIAWWATRPKIYDDIDFVTACWIQGYPAQNKLLFMMTQKKNRTRKFIVIADLNNLKSRNVKNKKWA